MMTQPELRINTFTNSINPDEKSQNMASKSRSESLTAVKSIGPCPVNVGKKANIRNRYNQVPHLTQDTTWDSDKNRRNYHIHDSQEVSPFPAGDHEAAMNRQDSMTDT